MPGRYQPVHQRLVLRPQTHRQRGYICLPLRFRPRTADRRGDRAGCSAPTRRRTPPASCPGHAHAPRSPARSRRLSGRHSDSIMRRSRRPARVSRSARYIGRVLAGQHAAGQRAVRHHAQPEIAARRQVLHLRLAVQRVVERLTGDRTIDARRVAQAADLRHPPAPVVRNAEITDLAARGSGPPAHALSRRAASHDPPCAGRASRSRRCRGGAGWPPRLGTHAAATGRARSDPARWGWRISSPAPTRSDARGLRGRRSPPTSRRYIHPRYR